MLWRNAVRQMCERMKMRQKTRQTAQYGSGMSSCLLLCAPWCYVCVKICRTKKPQKPKSILKQKTIYCSKKKKKIFKTKPQMAKNIKTANLHAKRCNACFAINIFILIFELDTNRSLQSKMCI